MIKTIFYKKSEDDNGDYWINGNPHYEWFVLENTLYEPNGNIMKNIKTDKNYIKRVSITSTEDRFTDEGIIRRIALYIEP